MQWNIYLGWNYCGSFFGNLWSRDYNLTEWFPSFTVLFTYRPSFTGPDYLMYVRLAQAFVLLRMLYLPNSTFHSSHCISECIQSFANLSDTFPLDPSLWPSFNSSLTRLRMCLLPYHWKYLLHFVRIYAITL